VYEAVCYLVTRISSDLRPPPDAVYGCVLPAEEGEGGSRSSGVGGGGGGGKGGVRVDALKVRFDHSQFEK